MKVVAYRVVLSLLALHSITCIVAKYGCEDLSLSTTRYIPPCRFKFEQGENATILWYHNYIFASQFVINYYISHRMTEQFAAASSVEAMISEFITIYFLYFINVVVVSTLVCKVFIKVRKMYIYDYYVKLLLNYLRDSGISPVLLTMVDNYTSRLWERQKGSWIPELALAAPQCLQEDIMCSMYLHHLHNPPVFRNAPHYFLRQLAAKFNRIVIFPENHIVQAGDIVPYIYFINEGDVEKYYLDAKGEKKHMGTLSCNGFFGVLAGLYPGTPFNCYYYTRTVVDLVYLRSQDLQSLLNLYPLIKKKMLDSAKDFGMELGVPSPGAGFK